MTSLGPIGMFPLGLHDCSGRSAKGSHRRRVGARQLAVGGNGESGVIDFDTWV